MQDIAEKLCNKLTCFNNFGQTNCVRFDNLLLSVWLFLQILNLLNNI